MDLHDHFDIGGAAVDPIMHREHCQFDQVGGRTLHGRINGSALRILSAHVVTGIDVLCVEPSTEYRFDETLFTRLRPRSIHKVFDARVAREVKIDVFLRGRAIDL